MAPGTCAAVEIIKASYFFFIPWFHLYNIPEKCKLIHSDIKQARDFQGIEGKGGRTKKGHQETFNDDGYVLYRHGGDGFMGLYMWQ